MVGRVGGACVLWAQGTPLRGADWGLAPVPSRAVLGCRSLGVPSPFPPCAAGGVWVVGFPPFFSPFGRPPGTGWDAASLLRTRGSHFGSRVLLTPVLRCPIFDEYLGLFCIEFPQDAHDQITEKFYSKRAS